MHLTIIATISYINSNKQTTKGDAAKQTNKQVKGINQNTITNKIDNDKWHIEYKTI